MVKLLDDTDTTYSTSKINWCNHGWISYKIGKETSGRIRQRPEKPSSLPSPNKRRHRKNHVCRVILAFYFFLWENDKVKIYPFNQPLLMKSDMVLISSLWEIKRLKLSIRRWREEPRLLVQSRSIGEKIIICLLRHHQDSHSPIPMRGQCQSRDKTILSSTSLGQKSFVPVIIETKLGTKQFCLNHGT